MHDDKTPATDETDVTGCHDCPGHGEPIILSVSVTERLDTLTGALADANAVALQTRQDVYLLKSLVFLALVIGGAYYYNHLRAGVR